MVSDLDAYGLTKEDFMENMKELQMVIEGDKVLIGKCLQCLVKRCSIPAAAPANCEIV